ncbi:glycosyltransferase family 2 protein [Microbulbifer magnicolonia]|uniref:glycosyltransferase n=1 Tax=Microbulbifer magnicolonia TaxID=3109744 RepID=UPI002B40FF08|nr:glycosyltransferase family 2 protein [Microbulbifer sp. GG15]
MNLHPQPDLSDVGIVVIGRNEGERLRNCLISLQAWDCPRIYVDSGSSDGSVALAKSYGYPVLELDTAKPLSAARARNEGLTALRRQAPNISYVQFIDGDCTLEAGWLQSARAYFDDRVAGRDRLAVLCGHLHERHAQSTVFTQLCELEWQGPVGVIESCGGISFANIKALQQVGLFNDMMIAGEEPELCYRLQQQGWTIERIDSAMAVHESDIDKFSQLLRRARRCGHSYAHSHYLHRGAAKAFKQRHLLSILFWGALLPLAAIVSAPFTGAVSTALLLLYPILWLRIYRRSLRESRIPGKVAAIHSGLTVVGKFAQLLGVADFYRQLIKKKQFQLIEYK